jgi:hypothetical protein
MTSVLTQMNGDLVSTCTPADTQSIQRIRIGNFSGFSQYSNVVYVYTQ